MMYVTCRFDEIKWPVTKKVPCEVCGKKLSRSTTFSQTENPFNRNDDGTIKTRSDIYRELRAEAEAWTPSATHPKCRESSTG